MTCEDTMAKITKTKSVPSTETLPTSTEKNPGRKRNKKKKFWKHTVKKEPSKVHSNSKAVLPPKAPQEFSSNWKALQELLKPKTTDLAIPQPTALSSKKPKTQEPKADGSSLGKESSSKVHPLCTDKTKEKPKGVGTNKVIAGSEKNSVDQKDKAGTKKRRTNGLIENKEKDIQHKKKKLEEKIVKPLTEDDLWFDDVDPEDIEAALGPEAAGLARKKLGLAELKPMEEVEKVLVKDKAFDGLTKAVAMDCEMVGVGPLGEDSIVARVSIVNHFGMCIYDKYVKPTEKVTDYRTAVSGIRPNDVKNGVQFSDVQKDVASILEGRILVGHAIHNDLKILFLDHPRKKIRDTQRYKPFKQEVKSGRPSLKLLCSKLLNVKVQTSEHSSVQDAQAAMRLYTLHKRQWEAGIKAKNRAQKQTPKDKPERQSP